MSAGSLATLTEMRSENVMHGVGLKGADISVLNADEEHIEMMMQWVNARR
ncbi:hypothetical protein QNH99_16425 [Pantoea allii]|nr:hypothetical protein [Pantoea allii]MDJ0040953.1 hypothetical protein [Pantoea allii]